MDMSEEFFSLSRVRELSLVGLLDLLGHEPVSKKKNDTDFWYHSPLREERTPSFHIDRLRNEWYDFGLAAGGNAVDFLLRYYRCGIGEMLEQVNRSFSTHTLPLFDSQRFNEKVQRKQGLIVRSVRPLCNYPLKNYLHDRAIPVSVADQFCREVSYEIGGFSYYGIGFANNSGGWEIRNKNFKQSSAPKDITCIGAGAPVAHVFEGFMDFLSYRTLHPYEDPQSVDYIILNGAGMLDRATPLFDRNEQVHLWLDRDVTGLAYRDHALSLGNKFIDESSLYEKFKDLNEWLCCKGEAPAQRQRLKVGSL